MCVFFFSADSTQSSLSHATFSLYFNFSSTDTNSSTVQKAIYDSLNRQSSTGVTKLSLGTQYVLSTSTNGVDFTPSLSQIVCK